MTDPRRQRSRSGPLSAGVTPARLGFGVFLAPHHPIGEHPTLQLQRDLELAEALDELHYDEFWVGEHHSAGWETIASREMFLVGAAERTKRIKLGTGVVSIRSSPERNMKGRRSPRYDAG